MQKHSWAHSKNLYFTLNSIILFIYLSFYVLFELFYFILSIHFILIAIFFLFIYSYLHCISHANNVFFNDKIDQCKNSVGNLSIYGHFYHTTSRIAV